MTDHQIKIYQQLPERDPSKSGEEQGMFDKFTVIRNDGKDEPGQKHFHCEHFVLDIQHDTFAKAALSAYAAACKETHPMLSQDMVRRYELSVVPSVSQLQAQIAQLQVIAASAEKWRGLASAKFGDGRTVQEIQSEATEGLQAENKALRDALEFMLAYENDAPEALQEIETAMRDAGSLINGQEFARAYVARKMRAALDCRQQ